MQARKCCTVQYVSEQSDTPKDEEAHDLCRTTVYNTFSVFFSQVPPICHSQ